MRNFICIILTVSSYGATNIQLTPDISGSLVNGDPLPANGDGFFGGSIHHTVNSAFAYDPSDPTSTSPVVTWGLELLNTVDYPDIPGSNYEVNANGQDSFTGFHGNNTGGITRLSYTFANTIVNTSSSSDGNFVVDLWGREYAPAVNAVEQLRDNNFAITLYDGVAVVDTISSLSIGETNPGDAANGISPFGRVVFDLTDGTAVNRLEISTETDYFTLIELRAATVSDAEAIESIVVIPEPTSIVLFGIGSLTLLTRRRRS